MTMRSEDFEQVAVRTAEELRDGLLEHHRRDDSVRLVAYKKRCGAAYASTSEVLDAVIAFGWTDGVRRTLDDDRTTQLISPRKTQTWAKSDKGRAARLESEGRMHASGRAAIARSKAAGLWNAMADVDALIIPEDLAAALAHPRGERPPNM